MIKFDLGFQVCCLLSIIKKKKKAREQNDNLSAIELNYKVSRNALKDREISVFF